MELHLTSQATTPSIARADPNSWYPPPQALNTADAGDAAVADGGDAAVADGGDGGRNGSDVGDSSLQSEAKRRAAATDPWPHSGWKFLPDMCQSFQGYGCVNLFLKGEGVETLK